VRATMPATLARYSKARARRLRPSCQSWRAVPAISSGNASVARCGSLATGVSAWRGGGAIPRSHGHHWRWVTSSKQAANAASSHSPYSPIAAMILPMMAGNSPGLGGSPGFGGLRRSQRVSLRFGESSGSA